MVIGGIFAVVAIILSVLLIAVRRASLRFDEWLLGRIPACGSSGIQFYGWYAVAASSGCWCWSMLYETRLFRPALLVAIAGGVFLLVVGRCSPGIASRCMIAASSYSRKDATVKPDHVTRAIVARAISIVGHPVVLVVVAALVTASGRRRRRCHDCGGMVAAGTRPARCGRRWERLAARGDRGRRISFIQLTAWGSTCQFSPFRSSCNSS